MKHAIIVGHPDSNSFTMAIARTYAATASSLGHSQVTRDLYRLEFDPCLRLSEMPDRPDWQTAPDVAAERQHIHDADVFAFIYPLWFNSPPAIVKGYIDRVFGVGFGYEHLESGGQGPLLTGRQLIHVTTSGSSSAWLNEQGAWQSMENLFSAYFARVCGMQVRPRIHFDSIVPGLKKRWIDTNLMTLQTTLRRYFAGLT
jgi:NAD(P)H dehydrogenase (quinone)